MTTRVAMFTYRNELTRRDEHIAVHRVLGFSVDTAGRTQIEIDYSDHSVQVWSSESLDVLKDRWRRLKEAIA